jgi:hypothetical protein
MNSLNSMGGQNSHLKQNMQDPDESIKDHTSTPRRMSHLSYYGNVNIPVVVKLGICLSRTAALVFSVELFYPSEYPTPRQQPMAGEGGTTKQPAESHSPEDTNEATNWWNLL